jgi:hypothetical protein
LFGDTSTKFSDRCPNAVIQTSSIPKSDIQVLWTAPPKGSGCVAFRYSLCDCRGVVVTGSLSKECPVYLWYECHLSDRLPAWWCTHH